MASVTSRFHPAELRPRDLGEILDHTFRVFKRAWKPLLLLGAIQAVPSVIQSGYLAATAAGTLTGTNRSTMLMQAIIGASSGSYSDLARFGLLGAGLMVAGWLLALLCGPAIIAVSSRAVLGMETTLGGALRIGLKRYWAMLGTSALKLLFLILGVIGSAIGGLLILAVITIPAGFALLETYMAFTGQAVVVEQSKGGMPAIRRSFGLVSGRFWPLLGIGIVAWIFFYVLTGQLSYVSVTPIQLIQMFYLKYHATVALAWVGAICSGLISALTGPLLSTILTLVYYDTRMRKEGFDMELLAAEPPVEV